MTTNTEKVAKKLLIAVHKIGMSDPDGSQFYVKGYDANGEPIRRKRTIRVLSGEFFEFPVGPELDQLFQRGAVREPTPAELALREKLQ